MEVSLTLELTTRSRRRGTRARRTALRWASGLLILMALTCVLPFALGLSSASVTDDAMGSTMTKGSAVILDSVPVADLEVGDVITYRGPGAGAPLLTRRIAQIEPGALRTSGDGTGALDPWPVILHGSTQHRAVAHLPYAGYVVTVMDGSTPWWVAGFLMAVIAAALVGGARAARRDAPSQPSSTTSTASGASVSAQDGRSAGSGMKLPRPRRKGEVRRSSSV